METKVRDLFSHTADDLPGLHLLHTWETISLNNPEAENHLAIPFS